MKLFLSFVFVVPFALSERSSSHDLRQFNGGHDSFYATKLENDEYEHEQNGKACETPEQGSIENADIQCSASSGCRVRCKSGYKMGSTRSLHLNCDSETGLLTYLNRPWNISLPPCLPQCKDGCPQGTECVAPDDCRKSDCNPPCQNGGTCIIPGVCNCLLGYSGLLCEQHRCDLPKFWPQQSTLGATTELTLMDVECNSGFKMKNGLTLEYFKCQHHQWVTKQSGLTLGEVDVNCYA